MRLRGAAKAAIIPALAGALLTVMTSGCASTQPARATASLTVSHATAGPGRALNARASVPWHSVGPGWVLTQYASAPPEGGSGPAVLYLISPGGTKYQLASWPSWRSAPQLVAWSPDGRRALFGVVTGGGGAEQLTLASGQVSRVALPGGASAIGYTTPSGLNIVAGKPDGDGTSLARYTLSGQLGHSLGYSADGQVLYQPSGTSFVTGASNGLKLVGNTGGLIRSLPVPGATANSCNPARWWDGATVLAACVPAGHAASQLWLVPVNGARPKALTPPRAASSRDLGDLDAWSLASGLYLQSAGPCGVLQIFRQAGAGSISLVLVPHTVGDNHILTVDGSRMLVQAPTSCTGSNSLLWFNPATRAEQWLIRSPASATGAAIAIPFYSRENGNL
jgi:hypothetical protein